MPTKSMNLSENSIQVFEKYDKILVLIKVGKFYEKDTITHCPGKSVGLCICF